MSAVLDQHPLRSARRGRHSVAYTPTVPAWLRSEDESVNALVLDLLTHRVVILDCTVIDRTTSHMGAKVIFTIEASPDDEHYHRRRDTFYDHCVTAYTDEGLEEHTRVVECRLRHPDARDASGSA